jgi:hypothetical protein
MELTGDIARMMAFQSGETELDNSGAQDDTTDVSEVTMDMTKNFSAIMSDGADTVDGKLLVLLCLLCFFFFSLSLFYYLTLSHTRTHTRARTYTHTHTRARTHTHLQNSR